MIPSMLRRSTLLALLLALPTTACLTFHTESPDGDDDDAALDDDDAVDDDDAADDLDMDGWSVDDGDCDDGDPTRHPEAEELCDGIDSNCDGVADDDLPGETRRLDFDNDGFGSSNPDNTISTCGDSPGYVDNDGDCADTNAEVNPDAREVCNGMDDDCDGRVDTGVLVTLYFDTDLDGHGAGPALGEGCPGPGYSELNDDCNDSDGGIWEDDNVDGDNDGWDRCAGDCDDADASVNPGKTELCNGVDDDCSGGVDDGYVRVGVVHGASAGTGANLKTQIDGFGYCGELIAAAGVTAGTIFPTEYAALIVVHNTTTEASGWTAPVDPFLEFHDRCLPTIGMGTGGLALFDGIGQTGFPTDLRFFNQGQASSRIVSPVQSGQNIWYWPNFLQSIGNNYVQVYGSGASRSMQSGAGNWFEIGHVPSDPSSLLLLRENTCGNFWFWGWEVALGSATADGKALFENVMYEALGPP